MKQRTFLFIIILATVSICGFLVIQIFWLGKAFDLSNRQFEHKVHMALVDVSSILCQINQHEILSDPIEKLSSNYFVVNLNNRIAPKTLETVLKNEFKNRQIIDDFEYGIFDCANEEMVYGKRVSLETDRVQDMNPTFFPKLEKDAYYFGVYFPDKTSNLAGEMWIWGFSSLVLIVVIVFFGFTLYVIIRQRQLSEIQRDFINNMTHEFRTPISSIRLSSDVLLSENIHSAPSRLNKYALIIKSEVTKLQHQVDRVLDIATMSNQEIKLDFQLTDVNEIIKNTVESCNLRVEEKGGSISLNFPSNAFFLNIDIIHFSNVISNLIDNSIKYNENNPIIKVSIISEKRILKIVISDNGKGIPAKFKKLIFKKFFRVPTGNIHDVKGFGLGLFYVKSIVEAHQGSIKVESSEVGTSFILSFTQHNG